MTLCAARSKLADDALTMRLVKARKDLIIVRID